MSKKFFRNLLTATDPWGERRSERDSLIELESHLAIARYGDFLLTDAVRPALGLPVVPREGFRRDIYADAERQFTVPVLVCSVSAEQIFDVFLDLLTPLGGTTDVVLETSHHYTHGEHRDFLRRDIEVPVLKSLLCDYEDMLLHDGCVGIAVIHTSDMLEVQWDEHKILTVYGQRLQPFEAVLRRYGIRLCGSLRTIPEAEHIHSSHDRFAEDFLALKASLGVDE
ncbi:MAG: hypothetical protein ACRC46_12460 [Thermoguttaceae bacterium]